MSAMCEALDAFDALIESKAGRSERDQEFLDQLSAERACLPALSVDLSPSKALELGADALADTLSKMEEDALRIKALLNSWMTKVEAFAWDDDALKQQMVEMCRSGALGSVSAMLMIRFLSERAAPAAPV